MVAVYTKRRLKNKQTNKIHDCLEWSHSPKKICVSLINQISLRATDQKAFKLVQFLRTKGYVTKLFYQALAHNSWHYWIRVFNTDVVTRLSEAVKIFQDAFSVHICIFDHKPWMDQGLLKN